MSGGKRNFKKLTSSKKAFGAANNKVDVVSQRAIDIGRSRGVAAAVDFLCVEAGKATKPEALRLLLGAAQMIDSTDPSRALRILDQALVLEPLNATASLAKSVVMSNLGDARGSVEALKVAVAGTLDHPQRILASLMLSKYGLLAEASRMCKAAFEEMGRPLAHASLALDIALQVADWDFATELIAMLRAAHMDGTFRSAQEAAKTNILWCDDELTNLQVVEDWAKRVFPVVSPKRAHTRSDPRNRRIRVGYLSSDYRVHPTAFLINGLFRNHNKEKFELYLYCSGWDDGSEIRREVLSHFDNVHLVSQLDDAAAAKLIESHQLDILVELNGATKSNRLGILAFRPAPVQICYLGWPGSVGGRFVDYIVADDYILPPERAALYPERILWVSGTYQVNDYAALPELEVVEKRDYGFQESDLILGMFNTINKVRREVWTAWMEILTECPRAKLWILDPGPDVRENLARETISAGVDLDRVVMGQKLPFKEHLKRMQVCDLIVDPWPIGGHTSAADALFARVPLLSMEGNSYSSRVGGSLLKAAGLESLVQPDRDAYIGFAIGLLKNPSDLRRLKEIISNTILQQPIFDSKARADDFERIYATLAQQSYDDTKSTEKTTEGRKGPHFLVRKKINLCVVAPPGYPHSQAFDELSEAIYFSVRDLGHECYVRKNQFDGSSVNLLLGAHLLSEKAREKIPVNSLIFNTEQIGGTNNNWRNRIMSFSKTYRIIDYSDKNIELLTRHDCLQVFKFEFGYQRQLDRIIKKRSPKYGAIFYGSITERRAAMLAKIKKVGVQPLVLSNIYGRERDELISDSAIVLNIHAYESKIFEIVRLSYLMNNGVPFLTEVSEDPSPEVNGLPASFTSTFDGMPEKIVALLSSPDGLVSRGLQMKNEFMAKRQSQLIKPLIEQIL